MKIHPNNILLALIAFFATWGEGMQKLMPRASLIFPLLVAVYMVFNYNNLIKAMHRGRIVPREFKYLFVFVIVHSIIYIALNYQSIGFGLTTGAENEEGFAYGKAANGVVIIRYFMFLLFCLYLTVALGEEKKLKLFSKYYVIGFMGTILLGGASHGYANALVRFSGGLQDPNSMAFDAIIALLFSLYLFNRYQDKGLRTLLVVSFTVEAAAILLSFSRGAILSLIVWGILYLFHKGLLRSFWKVAGSGAVLALVIFAVVKTMNIDMSLVETRFSVEEMRESKGANRGLIWEAYLSNWDKYFVTGMGIYNSPKIMIGNRQGVAQNYESHNLYIQWFAEYGIIGLMLYLLYWRGFLRQFRRIRGDKWYLMSMGGVFLVVTFFLNIDKGRTFWIVLAVLNMVWMGNQRQSKIGSNNESIQPASQIRSRLASVYIICLLSGFCTEQLLI